MKQFAMTLSACFEDASHRTKKMSSYMSKNNRRWRHSSKGVPLPPRADLTFKLPLAAANKPCFKFIRVHFCAVLDCARCTLRLGGDCDEVFSHPGYNSGLHISRYFFTSSNDTYLKLASCVCAKPIALVSEVAFNLTPKLSASCQHLLQLRV